jgi:L-amino acid N-acyltransferase YncA
VTLVWRNSGLRVTQVLSSDSSGSQISASWSSAFPNRPQPMGSRPFSRAISSAVTLTPVVLARNTATGKETSMTQPADADSADWQRHWAIDAGSVTLQPVTRRMAQDVLDGGPIVSTFAEGALHARIRQAMSIAIRDIEAGTAAALPTVWVIVRPADGRIVGDIGTHGPPGRDGCVEIGYSLAPSMRGMGVGTAAVAALVGRLAAVPEVRQIVAVTGSGNTASRRLLERLGFLLADELPDTGEVRYARDVS